MPPFQKLRGKLIEFHGSENMNLTDCALKWLHSALNSNEGIIAYYADLSNSISSELLSKNHIDVSRFIVANNLYLSEEVLSSVDVVVLDDLTLFLGKANRILKEASDIARNYGLVFLVLNQKRNILNHKTGIFEEKAFYENYVLSYADIIVDLDKARIERENLTSLKTDESVSFLENCQEG